MDKLWNRHCVLMIFLVDAELLPTCLDLSVASLRIAMSDGDVRTLVENGEGEDLGRIRLTLMRAGMSLPGLSPVDRPRSPTFFWQSCGTGPFRHINPSSELESRE
ncbi:DUF6522 family protein [Marinobacter subterrani]|uniref:DUF6522 family protein n=1 Tax=Marinobacter subterrani TaxID=1658765 RepID=UPI0038739D79